VMVACCASDRIRNLRCREARRDSGVPSSIPSDSLKECRGRRERHEFHFSARRISKSRLSLV
jgi:hypothetical protein